MAMIIVILLAFILLCMVLRGLFYILPFVVTVLFIMWVVGTIRQAMGY